MRAHSRLLPSVGLFFFSPADMYLFFFFFQAEDGIRDLTVTGVQTCALPILDAGDHALGVRIVSLEVVAPTFVVRAAADIEHRLGWVCADLLEEELKLFATRS